MSHGVFCSDPSYVKHLRGSDLKYFGTVRTSAEMAQTVLSRGSPRRTIISECAVFSKGPMAQPTFLIQFFS